MINLMPDEAKKQLRAARTNVVLIRYIGIIILSAGFLALVLVGTYAALASTQDNAKKLIAVNDTKASIYSSTEQQVNTLSASLSEARTILDQEILYSRVLMNIGLLMPAGTVLDEISLSSAAFDTNPITLTVYAKTTQDTVVLQNNFKSSPLFTNVNFETVSEASGGIEGYPVSATITLTLTRQAAQ